MFTRLDAKKRLALQEEKNEIEQKLIEAPKIKKRLADLQLLFDEASPKDKPAHSLSYASLLSLNTAATKVASKSGSKSAGSPNRK